MSKSFNKHYALVLYSGLCLLLALFVVLAAIYFRLILNINQELEAETKINSMQIQEALTMRVSMRERALLLWQMSIAEDVFDREEMFQNFTIYGNRYLLARQNLRTSPLTTKDRELLKSLDKIVNSRAVSLREVANNLIEAALTDTEFNGDNFGLTIADQSEMANSLDALIRLQETQSAIARKIASEKTEVILSELNIWLVVFIVSVLLFAKVIVDNANRQRKKLQSLNTKLKSLARHDTLTGLPNRLYLLEHMERTLSIAKRRKKSGAILFIDLDNFKPINDTYGHDMGDIFLKTVADEMQSHLRDSDLLARLGGDEFVVILFEIASIDDAIVVANKLLETVSTTYSVGEIKLQASASIGICTFPGENPNVSNLLTCADEAMYNAKQKGKNGYYLHPSYAESFPDKPSLVEIPPDTASKA